MSALDNARQCPKCGTCSGDDWRQCQGSCPVPGSPHHVPGRWVIKSRKIRSLTHISIEILSECDTTFSSMRISVELTRDYAMAWFAGAGAWDVCLNIANKAQRALPLEGSELRIYTYTHVIGESVQFTLVGRYSMEKMNYAFGRVFQDVLTQDTPGMTTVRQQFPGIVPY